MTDRGWATYGPHGQQGVQSRWFEPDDPEPETCEECGKRTTDITWQYGWGGQYLCNRCWDWAEETGYGTRRTR